MKAQAAVYDGIMLLVITTFSIALLYAYVGDYGNSQFEAVQTAHFLNYMQSMMKSIYTTDVSQLAQVRSATDEEKRVYGDFSCNDLEQYAGTSVADLMKKDLSDSVGNLDDKFGASPSLGSLAARCYMKEVMKPYSSGGYKYLLEVSNPRSGVGGQPLYGPEGEKLVTNSPQFRESGQLGCDSISGVTRGATVSIASTPFRVLKVNAEGVTIVEDFVLKLCLWPSREN